MGYIHGATHRRNPQAALQSLAQQIEAAKKHLAWIDQQIEAANHELMATQRKAAQAQRQHAAYARGLRSTAPDDVRAEAQRAYELAMIRHPDNATEGPRRRRILDREWALAIEEHNQMGAAA